MLVLGRLRQEDPSGALASQSQLLIKIQVTERPVFKKMNGLYEE